MRYNLKKVFYLDGTIEEHDVMVAFLDDIMERIKREEPNLKEELESAVKRMETPTEHYVPEKLRRENCYVRFEVYPLIIYLPKDKK